VRNTNAGAGRFARPQDFRPEAFNYLRHATLATKGRYASTSTTRVYVLLASPPSARRLWSSCGAYSKGLTGRNQPTIPVCPPRRPATSSCLVEVEGAEGRAATSVSAAPNLAAAPASALPGRLRIAEEHSTGPGH
jgi:hypothetical protein